MNLLTVIPLSGFHCTIKRQMAHDQEVVGSNPGTIYWMDVSDDASYYIKRKNENKGSQMKHTKKNI